MVAHRPDGTRTDAPIANRASYIGYKHDTRDFVRWMVKTTIFALKSRSADGDKASLPSDIKTTGNFKIAGLLSMASFIAKTQMTVSGHIYRLVLSIIRARTTHYEVFKLHVSVFPDPAIERSNETHRYFIDSMLQIFSIMGGNTWLAQQMQASQMSAETQQVSDINDVKEFIFSNKFDSLNVELCDDQSDSESDTDPVAPSKQQKNRKKKGGKGKKLKAAGKKHRKNDVDDVSLDHYRILEDDEDLMMSYTIAACAFKSEWIQIRTYVQDMWHDVAYDGLNGAIAGATSNLAIAKIKHTELEIFVDFPNNDSYENIVQALTRGDPAHFQALAETRAASDVNERCPEVDCQLDTSEQLLLYAYQDLVDFIVDFQKNRNGKPTKSMLLKLKNWDPDFCLQDASKQQRLQWRKAFTINWLYDMVNSYAWLAQKEMGSQCFASSLDWSAHGKWACIRNLFGLHDFAAFVTSLATLAPGTKFQHQILCHHVFQLQCIVDSTTAYRGWLLSEYGGHIINAPAKDFSPRRDMDMFMKGQPQQSLLGFEQSIRGLQIVLRREAQTNNLDSLYEHYGDLLMFASSYVGICLGAYSPVPEHQAPPPSRFSRTDPNGLWGYSPFLCGIGLVEGLQIAFNVTMSGWDGMVEPTLLVHLHNMLVHEKILPRSIKMYSMIGGLFSDSFFRSQRPPFSTYGQALDDVKATGYCNDRAKILRQGRDYLDNTQILGTLRGESNTMFKKTAQLTLYQDAGWNPSRIPDNLLHTRSAMMAVRLGQTKRNVDAITGEMQLEETDAVRHFKSEDVGCDCHGLTHSVFNGVQDYARDLLVQECDDGEEAIENHRTGYGIWRSETILGDLDVAMIDFGNDINGGFPHTGINYSMMTVEFFNTFMDIENQLRDLNNETYLRIFQNKNLTLSVKRYRLVRAALRQRDEECLRVMAKCLLKREDEPMCVVTDWHWYWKKMEDPVKRKVRKIRQQYPEKMIEDCHLM